MRTDRCYLCAIPHPPPDLLERQGEAHHGVRFGHRDLMVVLDGVDVSAQTFEAMAGPAGWVLLYPEEDGHKLRCPTDPTHGYAERRTGDVTVVSRWSEPVPDGAEA